ncbi:MAG: threonine synthase [Hyphomicrobiales bacterium]|nr:threonine synthase [Hyphomicrobiales bacterium]
MDYISTRGEAPRLTFAEALMAGLARDGGLYMPVEWPQFSPDAIAALAGLPYAALAGRVMAPFVAGSMSAAEMSELAEAAYARFSHSARAPLTQIGDDLFVLELFHGPTLAFKDFAMQALALLVDRELARTGERTVVLGATSGDTGAAAMEAFKGRASADVFILYPHGRVSDVQRRQMTTAGEPNAHALAVEGSFDDCQAIVKALFADAAFRDAHRLSAVNSINWARIMAQAPYYVSAATALGAPGRKVSFAVPTGNFGDAFAGYVALRAGLPIERLIVATNSNDILVRAFETGRYEPRGVAHTTSPSMDIQISSNFERLLFEASSRDAARIRTLMAALKEEGAFTLADSERAFMAGSFSARRADEATVAHTIAALYRETGYLADPHTAVAVAAAKAEQAETGVGPIVVLATAHPAKFPDAVREAAGVEPLAPARLAGALNAAERYDITPNDARAVARIIAERATPAPSSPAHGELRR